MVQCSWNQVSIQESTSKILPNLDAMHSDIRRLATNLDVKLHGLQQMFSGSNQQSQIDGVKHLKEFVQSAATVLSSASTVLSANDLEDEQLEAGDDFRSDFGDWFKTEVNVATLDWIYSTNGSTPIFDLSETGAAAKPLAGASNLSKGQKLSSLSITPAANQLSTENLSNLNLSASREYQPALISPKPKDKTKDQDKPLSNMDLVPAIPSLPIHNGTKSSEPLESPVYPSNSKEKRRSLVRLFSRKSPANERFEEEPKPKKQPLFRKSQVPEIRRKFVFVGDGACGKTCFLMSVDPCNSCHLVPF